MIFIEKCSLLVDRLGHTSECYIEVQQKRGGGGGPLVTPSGYAPASCLRELVDLPQFLALFPLLALGSNILSTHLPFLWPKPKEECNN